MGSVFLRVVETTLSGKLHQKSIQIVHTDGAIVVWIGLVGQSLFLVYLEDY